MRALFQKVVPVGSDSYTFSFKPEHTIDYTAGQFIELTLMHDDPDERGVRRWFTLSSAPEEDSLSITTRKVTSPSTFKNKLFSLKPGEAVDVSQPMGDFVLPIQHSVPVLFVVKGIGVTPLRSIVMSLALNNIKRPLKVLYIARSKADHLFRDELGAYTPDIDYIEETSLEESKFLDTVASFANKQGLVYMSGPEAFVEHTYKSLVDKEVKPTRLVTDYFHGYDQ